MDKNKFHITDNGQIKPCQAKVKCRYGGEDIHFDNKDSALNYLDKINEWIANSSNPELAQFTHILSKRGAKTYFVGGMVRDKLLGKESKDVDIEIHNISVKEFNKLAKDNNINIDLVGESFGVYKSVVGNEDIDFSFPRTENVIGRGHKDFEVTVDPFIGIEKASERRDFTIGTLMEDTETGEIIDLHNGRKDLENGIIRHTSDKFSEDGLRIYRAAQFASRFNFKIAPETYKLLTPDLVKSLPKERVYEELNKALSKSDDPTVFFKSLPKETLSVHFKGFVDNKFNNFNKIVENRNNIKDKDVYKELQYISLYSLDNNSTEDLEKITNEKNIVDKVNYYKNSNIEKFNNSSSKKEVLDFLYSYNKYPKHSEELIKVYTGGDKDNYIKDWNNIKKGFITGKDLIAEGHSPGPNFKTLLDKRNKDYLSKFY